MDVSIVIVNYNTAGLTLSCLDSVYKYTKNISFEVIVVDNNSSDNSVNIIQSGYPEVHLILNDFNSGFSKANNQAIQVASGDYIFLLNSDTYFDTDVISKLFVKANSYGHKISLAPTLLNVDGSIQRSYFRFPSIPKILLHVLSLSSFAKWLLTFFNVRRDLNKVHDISSIAVDYVIFAALFVHKTVFESVGLLDENMKFYHEDCEFGYRMYNNEIIQIVLSDIELTHIGGGSSKSNSFFAFENYYLGLIYFYCKHSTFVKSLILKFVFGSAFLIRAVMSLFGLYRSLELPSTYSNSYKAKPFAPAIKRSLYYFKFAFTVIFYKSNL